MTPIPRSGRAEKQCQSREGRVHAAYNDVSVYCSFCCHFVVLLLSFCCRRPFKTLHRVDGHRTFTRTSSGRARRTCKMDESPRSFSKPTFERTMFFATRTDDLESSGGAHASFSRRSEACPLSRTRRRFTSTSCILRRLFSIPKG